jgi:hypothetical protein
MAHKKKVHRFNDCGSNMGAGDRSDGSLTINISLVTCGTCKHRILDVIAKRDWELMRGDLLNELGLVAVLIANNLE